MLSSSLANKRGCCGNKQCLIVIAAALFLSLNQSVCRAATPLYGFVAASLAWEDGDASGLRIQNNSTTVGLAGLQPLSDDFTGIYRLEWGVDIINTEQFSGTYAKNQYLGLSSSTGSFFLGKKNTPFKNAGNNANVFIHYPPSFEYLIVGQTRANRMLEYNSPEFHRWNVFAQLITNQNPQLSNTDHQFLDSDYCVSQCDDNGYSFVAARSAGNTAYSFAFDYNVFSQNNGTLFLLNQPRNISAFRFVYNHILKKTNYHLLLQYAKPETRDFKSAENGIILSARTNRKKWVYKAQVASVTISNPAPPVDNRYALSSRYMLALGADYWFGDTMKMVSYISGWWDQYYQGANDNYLKVGIGLSVSF